MEEDCGAKSKRFFLGEECCLRIDRGKKGGGGHPVAAHI